MENRNMDSLNLKISSLVMAVLLFAGCAETPKAPPGPPPPQNLLGSTDELQLVVELSLNLAREYGGNNVLVVLEIDGTLLTGIPGQDTDPCAGPADTQSSAMRPVQENASQLVQRVQDAGTKVIVLTSRGPGCRSQTFADLRNNGWPSAIWPTAAGTGRWPTYWPGCASPAPIRCCRPGSAGLFRKRAN